LREAAGSLLVAARRPPPTWTAPVG